MSERELPNAVASEIAILVVMFQDKGAIEECLELGLKPSMFYDKRLKLTACACLELYAKGKAVDKEGVLDVLTKRGKLEEVGKSLIEELSTSVRYPGLTMHHVANIKDKAFRRKLIKLMQKAVNMKLPDNATNQEVADAINEIFISGGKDITAEGVAEAQACKELVADKVQELFEEAEKRGFHTRGTLRLLTRLVERLNKRLSDY